MQHSRYIASKIFIMQNPKPQLFAVENSLGSLESEVMQVIWNKRRVTVRDILNILKNERAIAYTTVMTVMDHLYQKGFLEREKIKKSYYYFPIIKRSDTVSISLSQLFTDLISDYGRDKILYHALKNCIFPKIYLKLDTYRLSVGYGIAFTFLFTVLGLSAFDLPQNISFFGVTDYLSLLLSDTNLVSDKLHLFFYAVVESLPLVNIFMILISFLLIILLFRTLSKTLEIKFSPS